MYGLTVYVREGLLFAQDLSLENLSLENSADSYLCFQVALLHSMSYFFFLYPSPSWSLCTTFDSISSNIHEVLSINPSANVFVFGDFIIHHKYWLTYSGGTDRSGELCYNFYITIDLTQMVNFPTDWKYQVKPHLSPWFSAACAPAIIHRNHFLHLYQKDLNLNLK